MGGTTAWQIKLTAEWVYSMRVLVARDGNATSAPPDSGIERYTVVEAMPWTGQTNVGYGSESSRPTPLMN